MMPWRLPALWQHSNGDPSITATADCWIYMILSASWTKIHPVFDRSFAKGGADYKVNAAIL
jgi:hypothetical protein